MAFAVVVGTQIVAQGQVPTDAVWTRGAGTNSYNTAGNWSTPNVPVNDPAFDYKVFVPDGQAVNFDVVSASSEISQLFLRTNASLTILPSRNLTVSDWAEVDGLITLQGGSFTAPVGTSSFTGGSARLIVENGTLTFPASTYQTTRAASETIFSANGGSSSLDLSSLETLSFGLGSGQRIKTISANSGGMINLGSLSSVSVTAADDDYLVFRTENGGNLRICKTISYRNWY